ncbi:MAG: hypothetical protein ACREQW_14395 [Candidatus Binatia bacterium]
MKLGIIFAVSAILSGVFGVISCSKEQKQKEATQELAEHGMTAGWKFSLPRGDPIQGRKDFVDAECYKCHEVKGETFPAMTEGEKGVGPELSQMAGMHPSEFFAESIILSTLTR